MVTTLPPQPTTTPTPGASNNALSTNPTSALSYQPIAPSGAPVPDSGLATARGILTPTTPTSAPDMMTQLWKQSGQVLDSITQAENAREQAANAASDAAKEAARVKASADASGVSYDISREGLAGSTAAAGAASKVIGDQALGNAKAEADRAAAISQAAQEKSTAIQTLGQNIATEAQNQSQFETSNAQAQSTDYISQKITQAQNWIKKYGYSGVTLDEVKQQDPNTYATILQAYNGNENAMKADYLANLPVGSVIGQPVINGSKVTFVTQDPRTKEYKTTTIDAGTNLEQGNYKAVNVPGVGVVTYNQDTGQANVLSGSSNPYYMANQAATLDAKKAMLVSRYGTAVNNIIRQLYPTPTSNPINLYSNALNYTAKLNTAYDHLTSGKSADKGADDLDLIDSYVKIANGGGQITEGQINALFNSLGYTGKATIEGGKVVGVSSLLTDAQRKEIYSLSKDNISAQKENALAATKVIGDRATRAGVPVNAITTPEDIIGLSSASNPSADAGASTDIGTQIQDAGGTDNGDGTYTMPDGSVVSGQ